MRLWHRYGVGVAGLYKAQGRYGEAEPLYERALAIDEKALEPDHPDVAIDLKNLALLYWFQGRYVEVEPLCERSLAIAEKALRPGHRVSIPDACNRSISPKFSPDATFRSTNMVEEERYFETRQGIAAMVKSRGKEQGRSNPG